jgi:hypothetical protein
MEDRQVWEHAAPGGRGVARRRVLEGAAVAGVAGVIGAVAWRGGGALGLAQQQPANTDLSLAELAATLVGIECSYLERGLEAGILSGRDLEIVTEAWTIAEAHEKLFGQIMADLGGAPVEEEEYAFPEEAFASRDAFLELSSELQQLWVGGWYGMLTTVSDPELFALGASLAGVRSRVSAVIAALVGKDPLPSPVETPLAAADLLDRVAQYRAG